jgi:hypothetical protein
MSATTLKQQQSATRSLDYHSCSVEDLRNFILSRTTLTLATIRKLNKTKLVSRLNRLDTQRTFLRFMDLPPELRLYVYELLLSIHGEESGKHHSAILQVPKAIHRESEPVLYCKNSFCMQADNQDLGLVVGSWKTTFSPLPHWAGTGLEFPAAMRVDMLFGLRHLTISLSFIAYNYTTPFISMAQICLALSSASNLKDLIVTNLPKDTQSDSVRLYGITSPVAFVHPSAKINIEGGSPALHSKLEDPRRKMHSHPDLTSTLDFGAVISRAVHLMRVGVSKETTYMIGIAMGHVQHKVKYQGYYGDVRELIATFQKLDVCVAGAEAELEDL